MGAEEEVTVPPYPIVYNWDGNPLGYTEYPQSVDELVEKVYAPIEDTQVGALFWCVGEHEAKWPSQDISVVGDAVGRVYETVWGMRRAESVRAMFERGDDPYAAMVRRGRELGVGVWASVRMNDNHFWSISAEDGEVKNRGNQAWWMTSTRAPLSLDEMTRTIASGLTQARKDHPEWCLGDTVPAWAATSWNMAVPEVRELRLRYIEEAMRLADWDGVELDWQRHGFHLPLDDAHRLRYTLTDLQRAVRRLADGITRERGRPFHVAVRVAATLEACRRIGYDIETWVEDGLCDVIIPSGNSGADTDVDMEAFRRIVDGTGVKLYPGLDTDFRLQARRLMPHEQWRDAWVRATAAELWDRGADGMYVFNWHATGQTRRNLLTTIGSRDTLRDVDKVYAAVHGVNVAQGTLRYSADMHDRLHAETPVALHPTLTGDGPTFRMPFHEDASGLSSATVELHIELQHFSPSGDTVAVTLDCELLGEPIVRSAAASDQADPSDVDENSWLVWALDPAGLTAGVHEVQVQLAERDPRIRSPLVVRHVEIHVGYE